MCLCSFLTLVGFPDQQSTVTAPDLSLHSTESMNPKGRFDNMPRFTLAVKWLSRAAGKLPPLPLPSRDASYFCLPRGRACSPWLRPPLPTASSSRTLEQHVVEVIRHLRQPCFVPARHQAHEVLTAMDIGTRSASSFLVAAHDVLDKMPEFPCNVLYVFRMPFQLVDGLPIRFCSKFTA